MVSSTTDVLAIAVAPNFVGAREGPEPTIDTSEGSQHPRGNIGTSWKNKSNHDEIAIVTAVKRML